MSRPTTRQLLLKKTSRSIKHNWGQFLAIIGITAIAVTLFLGLSANALSFEERVNRLYDGSNVADVWVTVDECNDQTEATITGVLQNEYKLSEDDYVIETRGYIPSYINKGSAYAIVESEIPTVCAPQIVDQAEGCDYLVDQDYLILDNMMLEDDLNTSLAVGSPVEISLSISLLPDFLQPFLPENIQAAGVLPLNFEVTASMNFAENINVSSFTSSCFIVSEAFFKSALETALISELGSNLSSIISPYIENLSFENQYVISLPSNSNSANIVSSITSALTGTSSTLLVYDLDSAPFNLIVQTDIDQAIALSYVFPFVFFFVAILVILTTMSQLIVKERMEIGTLKALGVSNNRIMASYMWLMLALVGIGLLIGVALGPELLPLVMDIKYSILYSIPSFRYVFPWMYFGITVGVLAVFTVLVVYLSCRSEMKLTPASSMRPHVFKELKAKPKKEGKKEKYLYLKMAWRNIRQNLAKSIMVVIGVAGCTALLVCGYGIDDTIDYSIESDMTNFYSADIQLTYSSGTTSLEEQLLAYDEVTEVEELRSLTASVVKEGTNVSYDTTVYIVPDQHEFSKVDLGDGTKAMISQKVQSEGNFKVGDIISFEIAGETKSIEIGGVYSAFVRHGIFISVNAEGFEDTLNTYTTGFVNVASGVDPEEFAKVLRSDFVQVTSYSTFQSTYDYVESIASSVSYMTLSIKIFAILLAVVVLFNITYMNYKERYRQIATLKVVGFNNVDIAKSLVYETMILVLVGAVIGLLLGFPLEILILFINRNAIVEFLYTCTWLTYLISALITLGAALVINILLALRIKGVPMVESLKSIE